MNVLAHRSLLRRAVTIGTAVFAIATSGYAQNLVTNGDFEIGPFAAPGIVTNWGVGGTGRIAVLTEGATSGTHAAALSEGGNFQGSTLSQTIATIPGQAYILEFDSGVFGQPTNTLRLRFQVFGNTTQLDETLEVPVFNTFDPAKVEFHHYFRPFVADSALTTIRFTDVGLGNASADVLVDAVSVIVNPLPAPAPTPAQLPLVNGDFETWPFNYPGTVAGWTLGGNQHIETISQGATSPIHSAGFSVGGNSTNNILSQTFSTVPGQTYNFDFDAGVFGLRNGAPLQLQAQIVGSNPAFTTTITPPDAATMHPSLVVFQHYHYTFVAAGNLATVQFTDLVGNNLGADVMLDTVSISPAVPTYLQWQMTYFNLAQRNDPNYGGWTADPDFDGVRNGLEYYFHMNPMVGIPAADAPSFPQIGLMSSGGFTYLTFSYHRLLGWAGNAPVVAVSNDLFNWDTTQTQIEQVGNAARADGFTDVITVRLKTPLQQGVTKKHFRLMLAQ